MARELDLATGWVEPGFSIGQDLAARLASDLDEAVATPWRPADLDDARSPEPLFLEAAGEPFPGPDNALDAILDTLRSARTQPETETYDGEILERDPDRVVIVLRYRGMPDDSGRGADYRVTLVETPTGWVTQHAETRTLCRRGTPVPPDYNCI